MTMGSLRCGWGVLPVTGVGRRARDGGSVVRERGDGQAGGKVGRVAVRGVELPFARGERLRDTRLAHAAGTVGVRLAATRTRGIPLAGAVGGRTHESRPRSPYWRIRSIIRRRCRRRRRVTNTVSAMSQMSATMAGTQVIAQVARGAISATVS